MNLVLQLIFIFILWWLSSQTEDTSLSLENQNKDELEESNTLPLIPLYWQDQTIIPQVYTNISTDINKYLLKYTELEYTNSKILIPESTAIVKVYKTPEAYYLTIGHRKDGRNEYSIGFEFDGQNHYQHYFGELKFFFYEWNSTVHYCDNQQFITTKLDFKVYFRPSLAVEFTATNPNDQATTNDKIVISASLRMDEAQNTTFMLFISIVIFCCSLTQLVLWIAKDIQSELKYPRYFVPTCLWRIFTATILFCVIEYLAGIYENNKVIQYLLVSTGAMELVNVLIVYTLLISEIIRKPAEKHLDSTNDTTQMLAFIICWPIYYLYLKAMNMIVFRLIIDGLIFNPEKYILISQFWLLFIVLNFIFKYRVVPCQYNQWLFPMPLIISFVICIAGCQSIMPSAFYTGYSNFGFLGVYGTSIVEIFVLNLQYKYGSRFCLPRKWRRKHYDDYLHSTVYSEVEEIGEWQICVNPLKATQLDYSDLDTVYTHELYDVGTYVKTSWGHYFHPNWLFSYVQEEHKCPVCQSGLQVQDYTD